MNFLKHYDVKKIELLYVDTSYIIGRIIRLRDWNLIYKDYAQRKINK